MKPEVVRSMLEAEPFHPFTIRLTSRGSHDISRPEWAQLSSDGGVLTLRDAIGLRSMIAVGHIVSIECVPLPIVRGAE